MCVRPNHSADFNQLSTQLESDIMPHDEVLIIDTQKAGKRYFFISLFVSLAKWCTVRSRQLKPLLN